MSARLAEFILFFPIFLFSLSFHEAAHAWTANRLGDPTARVLGRLTLNPLAHIDPIGTVLFPLLMFLVPGLLLFGWAKPVPVDTSRLEGGRTGDLKVSLAGPTSNAALALVFAGLTHALVWWNPNSRIAVHVFDLLATGVYLNLALAFFNLIPIPPLDGSHVLASLLPEKYLAGYEQLTRYGFLIMIGALYLGAFRLLTIPIGFVAGVLLP